MPENDPLSIHNKKRHRLRFSLVMPFCFEYSLYLCINKHQTKRIMSKTTKIPNPPIFRWSPKHLNHIAENIVFKKRNVSFLAINHIFRQPNTHKVKPSSFGNGHFEVSDFVPTLRNDLLRTRAERLKVIFRFDEQNNIIVITAMSENDSN